MESNLNILQLLNGNNKPHDPYLNNNYNHRPYPTRLDTQAQSNKEQLESLKNRLDKINQALEEKNKNDNDNTNNDYNNNTTDNHVPKPSEGDNTNGRNRGNNNRINKGSISAQNWKRLTKSKLYFQVQTVIPEDQREALNETVYYQN